MLSAYRTASQNLDNNTDSKFFQHDPYYLSFESLGSVGMVGDCFRPVCHAPNGLPRIANMGQIL